MSAKNLIRFAKSNDSKVLYFSDHIRLNGYARQVFTFEGNSTAEVIKDRQRLG